MTGLTFMHACPNTTFARAAGSVGGPQQVHPRPVLEAIIQQALIRAGMDPQQALQQGIGLVRSFPPGLGAPGNVPGVSSTDAQIAELKRQLDEEQLQALQLQCVLVAKDRELSLVRQHISSGESQSDDLLQAIQRENEALRRQLADAKTALKVASDTQPQPQPQLPPPLQHKPVADHMHNDQNSTRTSLDRQRFDDHGGISMPVMTSSSAKWPRRPQQQAAAHQGTAIASTSGVSGGGSHSHDEPDEVLVLNVSGVEMCALRSTLTMVPSSHLCQMFRRHSPLAPPWDDKRRYFLPFSASAFALVLEALQAQQVLGIEPSPYSLGDDDPYLQQLLEFLGLHNHFYATLGPGGYGRSTSVHTSARAPFFLHEQAFANGGSTSNTQGNASHSPPRRANSSGGNVTSTAVKGSRHTHGSSSGPPAGSHVERVSSGAVAGAVAPGVLPDAVAAALRPRVHAEAGDGAAPTAMDATQVALAGLRVPNMYEVMARKAAAGDA